MHTTVSLKACIINKMEIRKKLLRLRNRSGRTRRSVARHVGFTERTISMLENGKTLQPNVVLCLRLARLYGVDLDWLADEERDWPPPTDAQTAAQMVDAAMARAGLSGELSVEEQRVLSAWRSLNDRQRLEVMGYISGFAAAVNAEGEALARRLAPALARAEQKHQTEHQQPPSADRAG